MANQHVSFECELGRGKALIAGFCLIFASLWPFSKPSVVFENAEVIGDILLEEKFQQLATKDRKEEGNK